jgi:tetratricopeptide (TPR) repeat protein
MNKLIRPIGITIVVVVLLIIGILALRNYRNPQPAEGNTPTSVQATTTVATSTAPEAGYTVTPVIAPKRPNASAALSFMASVSESQRSSMQNQFIQIQDALKTSPNDFNAWIALGGLRKTAGDYAGAATDWEYVSKIYPTNVVSFANLADLYSHYAPNDSKAASAYAQAIKNNPRQIYLYDDFYQLYSGYPAAGTSLATALKTGIKANPKESHLQVLLARYYKSIGDMATAKVEYNAAIATAQAQGASDVAAQIQTELNSL